MLLTTVIVISLQFKNKIMKRILTFLTAIFIVFMVSCTKEEYIDVQDLQTNKIHVFNAEDASIYSTDTVILHYIIDSRNTSNKDVQLYNNINKPKDYVIEYTEYVEYHIFQYGIIIRRY